MESKQTDAFYNFEYKIIIILSQILFQNNIYVINSRLIKRLVPHKTKLLLTIKKGDS